MATPVVLTTGARPIVPVESGGVPMTPVDTLGEPVTVVNTLGEPVVLINNDGTPAFLAYSAKTYLGGVAPYHWLDFINNRALYAGADVGNVTQATGYSFTRASTGYYQNADGTLEWFESGQPRMKRDAPNGHNIFLHSEALTTANNWTTPFVSNATRTDGALSVTTDEGFVYFARTSSILSGATYTVSADVVCDQTISNVPLRISSSTATSLLVNFVAGVTQRITFAAITGSGDGSVQIGLDARDAIVPGGSNATGYTVTFNKVQLNEGSSATAYVATTTTPVYAARRGDRGVLIEGARTNLLVRSQEFDNASWTKANTTVAANSTAAPDGTTTADTLTENTANDEHYAAQAVTKAATATTYTASIYAKSSTRNILILCRQASASANNATIGVNLTSGAVGLAAAAAGTFTAASGIVTTLANGWFRIALTFTTSTETDLSIRHYVTDGTYNGTFAGDGTSGIFIWGAQLEAASFASSYVKSEAAAATRASDVLTYTAGVTYPLGLWAEFERAVDTGGGETILNVNSGASTNESVIYISGADKATWYVIAASSISTETASAASVAVGVVAKFSGRAEANSFNFALNGTAGTTDTTGNEPASPTVLRIGTGVSGLIPPFGYIRRAAVFNFALTNAQLQTTTS